MKAKLIFFIIMGICFLCCGANGTVTNQTALYLTMNGTAGSTTFTDQSPLANTVTANGNVAVSNTQTVFYNSSVYDGNGDYLNITPSTNFNFLHKVGTAGNWSMSFWYYCLDNAHTDTFFDTMQGSYSNNGFAIYMATATNLQALIGAGGSAVTTISTTWSRSNNVWYYIVVTYDQSLASNNMKIYVNGTLLAQATKTATTPGTGNNVHAFIGLFNTASPTYALHGYADDFIIINNTVMNGTVVPDREFISNPLASFTANTTSGGSPLTVSFTNTSAGNINTSTYLWTDNGTSFNTSASPVQTFSAIGNHTISLTVTNPFGTSTNTTTIAVSNSVSANFTGTPVSGVFPLNVSFTDTSTGSPTSWNWTFGDGNTSTLQNPYNIYSAAGVYDVHMEATNAYGSSWSNKTAYINVSTPPPPTANFTSNVTSGPAPLNVSFTDTSTGSPTSWNWTFGDGNTSTLQNPVHMFSAIGTYTVTLTAANVYGNTSISRNITVAPLSGFTEQDLLMLPQYTLTLNFVDSQTADPVLNVMVLNPATNSTVNTTTGTYTGTYGYSTVVLYCYASGYDAKAVSYVMTRDRVETVQLVKSTTSTQTSTTWYTPKTISIKLVDVYGNIITGATINAQYNSTTLPSGVSDLIYNFGMNSYAANEALNGTIIMNGTTDTNGVVVFTMLNTVKYDVTAIYNGNTNYYSLYPQQSDYQFKFLVGAVVDNIWADLYANGNTKVWVTEPDIANVTFWWSFQDMTNLTTRVDYYLKDMDLNTTIYTTNTTSPIAGGIYQLNYTMPNVRGKNYLWWENYTRSV